MAYEHFFLLPLFNAVSSFGFIISLIGLFRLLHPRAGIANHLQARSIDGIEAYDHVSSAVKDIKSTRKNTDEWFSVIFEQAEREAAKVKTQSSMQSFLHSKKTSLQRQYWSW